MDLPLITQFKASRPWLCSQDTTSEMEKFNIFVLVQSHVRNTVDRVVSLVS